MRRQTNNPLSLKGRWWQCDCPTIQRSIAANFDPLLSQNNDNDEDNFENLALTSAASTACEERARQSFDYFLTNPLTKAIFFQVSHKAAVESMKDVFTNVQSAKKMPVRDELIAELRRCLSDVGRVDKYFTHLSSQWELNHELRRELCDLLAACLTQSDDFRTSVTDHGDRDPIKRELLVSSTQRLRREILRLECRKEGQCPKVSLSQDVVEQLCGGITKRIFPLLIVAALTSHTYIGNQLCELASAMVTEVIEMYGKMPLLTCLWNKVYGADVEVTSAFIARRLESAIGANGKDDVSCLILSDEIIGSRSAPLFRDLTPEQPELVVAGPRLWRELLDESQSTMAQAKTILVHIDRLRGFITSSLELVANQDSVPQPEILVSRSDIGSNTNEDWIVALLEARSALCKTSNLDEPGGRVSLAASLLLCDGANSTGPALASTPRTETRDEIICDTLLASHGAISTTNKWSQTDEQCSAGILCHGNPPVESFTQTTTSEATEALCAMIDEIQGDDSADDVASVTASVLLQHREKRPSVSLLNTALRAIGRDLQIKQGQRRTCASQTDRSAWDRLCYEAAEVVATAESSSNGLPGETSAQKLCTIVFADLAKPIASNIRDTFASEIRSVPGIPSPPPWQIESMLDNLWESVTSMRREIESLKSEIVASRRREAELLRLSDEYHHELVDLRRQVWGEMPPAGNRMGTLADRNAMLHREVAALVGRVKELERENLVLLYSNVVLDR
mgnify:CR=1 FL=1